MMTTLEPIEVPEWAHWGQREGLVLPRYRGLGPTNRRICRWCDNECQPPRVCWCSDECVQRYQRVWTWDAMRDLIRERDAETCQRCGTTDPPPPESRQGWRTDPWDVDHIVPVRDGGTDDPANLRLLCIPCHVEVGYEQRRSDEPDEQIAFDLEAQS